MVGASFTAQPERARSGLILMSPSTFIQNESQRCVRHCEGSGAAQSAIRGRTLSARERPSNDKGCLSFDHSHRDLFAPRRLLWLPRTDRHVRGGHSADRDQSRRRHGSVQSGKSVHPGALPLSVPLYFQGRYAVASPYMHAALHLQGGTMSKAPLRCCRAASSSCQMILKSCMSSCRCRWAGFPSSLGSDW